MRLLIRSRPGIGHDGPPLAAPMLPGMRKNFCDRCDAECASSVTMLGERPYDPHKH